MTNGGSACNGSSYIPAVVNWTNTTSTSSFNSSETNHPQTMTGSQDSQSASIFNIIAQIEMFGDLVIIPMGIFVNVLSVMIFVKSRMAWTPVGLHLMYLAIADSLVLVSGFAAGSRSWHLLINIPDLWSVNTVTCVGTYYTINVGFTWSGLLLASSTIERFLSIAFPLKVKSLNLYRKSKILMGVYLMLSLLLSSYIALCFEIITVVDFNICAYSEKYKDICDIGNMILNVVIANALCFTLILVFTILTSVSLRKYAHKRATLGFASRDTGREFRATVMLVTVASLFLVLRVGEMIIHFLNLNQDLSAPVAEMVSGVAPIFILLVNVNHSVNFFIYLIFLPEFRRTLVQMFSWCRIANPQSELCEFRESGESLKLEINLKLPSLT